MNQQVMENGNGGRVRIYIVIDTEAQVPVPISYETAKALDDACALIRHVLIGDEENPEVMA